MSVTPHLPAARDARALAVLNGTPSLREVVLRRRVDRAVQRIAAEVEVRQAVAVTEAAVAAAKVRAAAQVAREAAASATALHHYVNALAGGDPLLRDELRHFENVFRAGAGDILFDLFSTYSGGGLR